MSVQSAADGFLRIFHQARMVGQRGAKNDDADLRVSRPADCLRFDYG